MFAAPDASDMPACHDFYRLITREATRHTEGYRRAYTARAMPDVYTRYAAMPRRHAVKMFFC